MDEMTQQNHPDAQELWGEVLDPGQYGIERPAFNRADARGALRFFLQMTRPG